MNFDFEISRVVFQKETISLFNIKKIHLNLLKHAPLPPLFSARKTLSTISTRMHLVLKTKYFLFFPSVQLIIHSLTHVDHLTGELL